MITYIDLYFKVTPCLNIKMIYNKDMNKKKKKGYPYPKYKDKNTNRIIKRILKYVIRGIIGS